MPTFLGLLGIFCVGMSAFAPSHAKVEIFTGRIVAYANPLTCLNGNAYWSMIIYVQERPRELSSEFIQVPFSLRCGEVPRMARRQSSFQKFRLIRVQESDSVLKEFMDCHGESSSDHAAQPCPPIPIWKHIPGEERHKLPFGQRVRCYHSADLPLAPLV